MSDELVITVAPCGAETTRDHNPAVPYTPAEIAAEARRSFEAGARMIHVHARWDDGAPTQDAGRYRETVAAIRAEAPEMIVQVSTGGAIGMTTQERLGSLAAEPEMASLTCGTVNFGRGVFENPAPAHDRHPIRERKGFVLVVGDVHRCDLQLRLQVAQLVAHLVA